MINSTTVRGIRLLECQAYDTTAVRVVTSKHEHSSSTSGCSSSSSITRLKAKLTGQKPTVARIVYPSAIESVTRIALCLWAVDPVHGGKWWLGQHEASGMPRICLLIDIVVLMFLLERSRFLQERYPAATYNRSMP